MWGTELSRGLCLWTASSQHWPRAGRSPSPRPQTGERPSCAACGPSQPVSCLEASGDYFATFPPLAHQLSLVFMCRACGPRQLSFQRGPGSRPGDTRGIRKGMMRCAGLGGRCLEDGALCWPAREMRRPGGAPRADRSELTAPGESLPGPAPVTKGASPPGRFKACKFFQLHTLFNFSN